MISYCKAELQQQKVLTKTCLGCQVMVQLHLMPDPNRQQILLKRRPCPCICFAPVVLCLVNVTLQGESDQLTVLKAITFGDGFLLQRRQWKWGSAVSPSQK